MSLMQRIRLLGSHHALHGHGTVLDVTESEAAAANNRHVVHRRHADDLVAKGHAEWVDPQDAAAAQAAAAVTEI